MSVGTGSAPLLTPELLLIAYGKGFFPMADGAGAIHWHSPDPRAVFELEAIRPNKRFMQFLRNNGLHCTLDAEFEQVMRQCSTTHGDSWITEEMIAAYTALHRMGHAHSVFVNAAGITVSRSSTASRHPRISPRAHIHHPPTH